MTGSTDSPGGLQIVIENLSEEGARLLVAGVEWSGDGSALGQLIGAVPNALCPKDHATTRLVITGDLIATVNLREDTGQALPSRWSAVRDCRGEDHAARREWARRPPDPGLLALAAQ